VVCQLSSKCANTYL
jgi:hypothetical protein